MLKFYTSKLLFWAILAIGFNQCTSLEFHNPIKGTERILASREVECKSPFEYRHWTILYGTVPIRFLNKSPEDFLEGKSFRITEKADVVDFIISIIGGFSTSITTRTIRIENCEQAKIETQIEKKIEETPKKDDSPDLNIQTEIKTDKSPIPDSEVIEKPKSVIMIDETSLLDDIPESETKPSKKQDKKVNNKKKK